MSQNPVRKNKELNEKHAMGINLIQINAHSDITYENNFNMLFSKNEIYLTVESLNIWV